MEYTIEDSAFPVVKLKLKASESIKVVSSAVIGHSGRIKIRSGTDGGLLKSLGRMVSGDSMFFQYATSERTEGDIWISSRTLGTPSIIKNPREGIRVVKDALLACEDNVEIISEFKTIVKSKILSNSVKVVKLEGRGLVVLGGLGSIIPMRLDKDEEFYIDSGSLVGYTSNMSVVAEKSRNGLISMLTGDNTTMCRIVGEGTVLIRSCNSHQFKYWMCENEFMLKSDINKLVNDKYDTINNKVSKLEVSRSLENDKSNQNSSLVNSIGEDRLNIAMQIFDNLESKDKLYLESSIRSLESMPKQNQDLIINSLMNQGFSYDLIRILEESYRNEKLNSSSIVSRLQ